MPIFRRPSFTAFFFVCLLALFAPLIQAANPLPAEKAFAMRVRAISSDTVEILFEIAPNYYLFSDRFAFEANPAEVALGHVDRPPGEIKNDPVFGEVETYSDQLRMRLPVNAPPGIERFTLAVTSQGCWEGGICYPPTVQRAVIELAALTASPENRDNTSNSANDESGRLAGLLSSASVPLALAVFFGLGLLLALTPCVFPMIPILSGIIVGTGAPVSRPRALALSVAYVLGMALTYALAGIVAGLTGSFLSAALQNTWVLLIFALLLVLLALSMFGFFELRLPAALQNFLANTANRQKRGLLAGVALMGAISALILSPCVTAPLAGALLYIAQTGDAVFGGLALFALALGMGVPLIIVAMTAHTLLPRAGSWMEGVRKAVGVLLLAVALWIAAPALPGLAVMLGWAALLLFPAIFLSALDPLPVDASGWRRFWKGVGIVLLVSGVAILVGALAGSRDPLQPLAAFHARPGAAPTSLSGFENIASEAELDARLKTVDRPVFLEFYADWCAECKKMERNTFSDPAVATRMARMRLLRVDVTDYNDSHKALLKRFGLVGPPGVVFFGADGQLRDDLRVVGFMPADKFSELLDRVF
ncbi:MAG: protein-disulfide reductase DsbD [Azoarcus sp.]|jgi:thiol:disulfide interchange protein DsbD|nr:protein-disulfide reductase DsbD [Azoarcus sp.]